jgi:hypothetical protein
MWFLIYKVEGCGVGTRLFIVTVRQRTVVSIVGAIIINTSPRSIQSKYPSIILPIYISKKYEINVY